jgi:hypothetical protein
MRHLRQIVQREAVPDWSSASQTQWPTHSFTQAMPSRCYGELKSREMRCLLV